MNRAYRNIALRLVLLVVVSIAGVSAATAQYFPERGLVREGNKQFERRNFRSALNRYEEALEHDSLSYEAQYNRANASAQYLINNPSDTTRRTERWRLSNAYYETLAADSLLSDVERAEVLRNLGESLFAQQQYEAALNSFRESLLLNADDSETKNNYVLTKRIVDQKRRMQQQNQTSKVVAITSSRTKISSRTISSKTKISRITTRIARARTIRIRSRSPTTKTRTRTTKTGISKTRIGRTTTKTTTPTISRTTTTTTPTIRGTTRRTKMTTPTTKMTTPIRMARLTRSSLPRRVA